MKKLKRGAALLIAAAMLLALAACGGDTPGAQETETPEYVYVASYSPIDMEINYVNTACYFNGRIYFVTDYVDGQITETYPAYDEYGNPMYDENGEPVMEEYSYDNYVTGIFSMAEDGSDVQRFPGYQGVELPEGYDGSSYVSSMFAGGDRLYVLESVNMSYSMNSNGQIVDYDGNVLVDAPAARTAAAPEVSVSVPVSSSDIVVNSNGEELTYVYEDHMYLRSYDDAGTEIATVDLSSLGEGQDYFYINGAVADGEGNVICYDSNANIYVLGPEGDVLSTIAAREDNDNTWIYDMVTMRDGSVGVLMNTYDQANQTNITELRPVDTAAKALGDAVEAPSLNGQLLPGSGDYDYYMDNGTSLFGCKAGSAEAERLITWINSDVDSSNLSAITPLADGRIVAISSEYSNGEYDTEAVIMTETPYSELPQKTTLTYACLYLNYQVRTHILDFNRTNPTYRIEVRDYSEYNTDEDYNAGLTRLTTDIVSGNAPDLIATDQLPVNQFSGKGLFEDLWPYIEADTELGGRSGVVEEFFNAISLDGKLYTLYPSFYLITFEGPTALFGEEMGITFEQVREAMAQNPEITTPMADMTRDDMLNTICQLALDSYIDWETGTCSFDQGFAEVLEFCNLFPEEYQSYDGDYVYVDPIVKLRNGEVLLVPSYVSDFTYSRVADEIVEGGTTFVGIPGVGGSGAAFTTNTGIAMSTTCADKDGAWQFMRRYVAGGFYDYVSGFSSNRAEFDTALEEAMTPTYVKDENGNEVEQPVSTYWLDNDNTVEIYAMTQEEADRIINLISGTTATMTNADEQLVSIITEEAAAYFAGQRSAQDAAAMIQSRASIYVSEQS